MKAPLVFGWNFKALVVDGDIFGVSGAAIPNSIILTRSELEELLKDAFETFRMRGFPHNEPTFEQYFNSLIKQV